MLTVFPELDALLRDLDAAARAILGADHVGTYVQGSFALGAGDEHSDCDFVVVTRRPPRGRVEAALRALHDAIPTRPGFWTAHLEGSYADAASLRDDRGLDAAWLFCDHGHRTLLWDRHCNTPHTRWILHHRGITVSGPPPETVIGDPAPEILRASARASLRTVLPDVLGWAPPDIAWTQRYIVATCCRALYTLRTARVASKRGALEWGLSQLDPRWRPLLRLAIADRHDAPWDAPARSGGMAETREFAAYAATLAGHSGVG